MDYRISRAASAEMKDKGLIVFISSFERLIRGLEAIKAAHVRNGVTLARWPCCKML